MWGETAGEVTWEIQKGRARWKYSRGGTVGNAHGNDLNFQCWGTSQKNFGTGAPAGL